MSGIGRPRRAGHRLLLVIYHWPPFPGGGAARWVALVKYLRQFGHEVTVVTTSAFGVAPAELEQGVVRTSDLNQVQALRRLLRRPPLTAEGTVSAGQPAPGMLWSVPVPDPYAVSWLPFALRTARRAAIERRVDCLITSSPPDSVHLAGLFFGRRRPAWIADLRDGWIFEPLKPELPTHPQRSLDAKLERSVCRSADALTVATKPIADDIESRLGQAATIVPNAWDPDLDADVAGVEPPPLDPNRVNLVYTGSLGGIRGHDEGGLLDALREIVRANGPVAERLRVVFAGPLTEAETRILSAPDISPVVRLIGTIPRSEALALQRAATALLLITSHDASISTAKLFEYLAAGRPILALAGKNEAARIVAETGTGTIVAPDDVPGIERALATVVSGGLDATYEPHGLENYRFPAPAEELSDVIERALSNRARR